MLSWCCDNLVSSRVYGGFRGYKDSIHGFPNQLIPGVSLLLCGAQSMTLGQIISPRSLEAERAPWIVTNSGGNQTRSPSLASVVHPNPLVFVFQVLGFLKATVLAGQEEVNHLERGPVLRSGECDSEGPLLFGPGGRDCGPFLTWTISNYRAPKHFDRHLNVFTTSKKFQGAQNWNIFCGYWMSQPSR